VTAWTKKSDLLREVTAWAGLTVNCFEKHQNITKQQPFFPNKMHAG
jgi:hypothetical protein